jgi:ATP-dependent protease HslVU (ClpYQ) peptidase subunit
MRLIEKEMNSAINNARDWGKDNTRVECVYTFRGYWADVYLHGHLIAGVLCRAGQEDMVKVNVEVLKQWPTRTTMSRLRALGVDVCTRKGVVILDGKPI